MQTQMKNTIYILTLGVLAQIIFWSFVSSLVGAETIRGLKSEIRNLKKQGLTTTIFSYLNIKPLNGNYLYKNLLITPND